MLEITIKANSISELRRQVLNMASELQNGTEPVVTKEMNKNSTPTKEPKDVSPTQITPPSAGTAIEDTTDIKADQVESLLPKLQELGRTLITAGKSADIKAVITSVGATTLSGIPVNKQREVLAALELL